MVPPVSDISTFADTCVTKKRSAGAKQASDTSENELVEKIPGGFVVRHANGQALVYLYCGANETEALKANACDLFATVMLIGDRWSTQRSIVRTA
jgi:hypothetical protein